MRDSRHSEESQKRLTEKEILGQNGYFARECSGGWRGGKATVSNSLAAVGGIPGGPLSSWCDSRRGTGWPGQRLGSLSHHLQS